MLTSVRNKFRTISVMKNRECGKNAYYEIGADNSLQNQGPEEVGTP